MESGLPLFARLSHMYTAFTMAADNSFELRVPHRTTRHGGVFGAPWLVSTTLWHRFLRHIPPDGEIGLRDLKLSAALPPNEFKMWLTRFESWWGYLRADHAAKTVRPTFGGRAALLAFPQVIAATDATWRTHFPDLYPLLTTLVTTLETEGPLQPCLGVLNYGLFAAPVEGPSGPAAAPMETTLPVLLAKALNAFAFEYERESLLALPLSANILRVIPPEGAAVRDLPRAAGVSKEAVTNATKLFLKTGVVKPYVTSEFRGKALRRTDRGDEVHAIYKAAITTIESRWRKRAGAKLLTSLVKALPTQTALIDEIKPAPGNWRADLPAPQNLPYFPMISHRGGFPDGS